MKISACVITLNEERNLVRCLASVAPLVDEILVVIDSGSTDRTLEIAREFGARVVEREWLGYVAQKNFALDQAAHEWVLSIDADEEISPELGRRHRQDSNRKPEEEIWPAEWILVFAHRLLPWSNGFRHGDWYPDRLVRFFRRARRSVFGRPCARKTGNRARGTAFAVLLGHLRPLYLRAMPGRPRRAQREPTRRFGRRSALWSREDAPGPLSASGACRGLAFPAKASSF